MDARWRLRQVANLLNLSTPIGLLLALAGRARITRGVDGILLAHGWRLPAKAPAFTIGNVVLLRLSDDDLARRPRLLVHEARHSTQYACCVGPVMFLLYLGASAWSHLRCGDHSSYNVFEVRAGLEDGGYTDRRRRSEARA